MGGGGGRLFGTREYIQNELDRNNNLPTIAVYFRISVHFLLLVMKHFPVFQMRTIPVGYFVNFVSLLDLLQVYSVVYQHSRK